MYFLLVFPLVLWSSYSAWDGIIGIFQWLSLCLFKLFFLKTSQDKLNDILGFSFHLYTDSLNCNADWQLSTRRFALRQYGKISHRQFRGNVSKWNPSSISPSMAFWPPAHPHHLIMVRIPSSSAWNPPRLNPSPKLPYVMHQQIKTILIAIAPVKHSSFLFDIIPCLPPESPPIYW